MVRAEHIVKTFGSIRAIDDVSFTAEPGAVLGILGRPGSGKTTLMNILSGSLRYNGGALWIGGYDMRRHPTAAKASIGYMPGGAPVYGMLTIREAMQFALGVRRRPQEEGEKILAHLGLQEDADVLLGRLSEGKRRTFAFGTALVGKPQTLLLDQPFENMDSGSAANLKEIIAGLRSEHTILIATDSIQEVAETCSNALVLSSGRVAANTTVSALLSSASGISRFKLCVQATATQIEGMAQIAGVIGVETASRINGYANVIVEAGPVENIQRELWQYSVANNIPILEMKPLGISLEDVFLQLTGKGGAP